MSKQNEVLEYVQKQINNNTFPGQEIWIRNHNFWVFSRVEDGVSLTQGNYSVRDPVFSTSVVELADSDRVEQFIEEMIEQKREDGFECVSMRL